MRVGGGRRVLMGSLLTVAEAAEFLRIRKGTLYQWVEERPPRVPYIRLGRRAVRFDRQQLVDWLESQRVEAT
jgi:excisionase family DNA binding protein